MDAVLLVVDPIVIVSPPPAIAAVACL
jgi:hypothetical protein